MSTHSARHRPSAFVERSVTRIALVTGLVLDIPCGRCRHALALNRIGLRVVAADLDIATLHSSANIEPGLMRVQLDANRDLPFLPGIFDLAIVVHPHTLGLLATVPLIVRPGGYLILETFGAHGHNWRRLPRPGEVSDRLSSDFEILEYAERRVHNEPPAVTVKALFRKR